MLQLHSKWRWVALLALVLTFFVGLWAMPWLLLPRSAPCPPGAPGTRVIVWNMFQGNEQPVAAAAWLAASGADALLLLEAKGSMSGVVAALAPAFPHATDCHRRTRCSTWIAAAVEPSAFHQLGRLDVENRKGLSALAVELRDGPKLVAVHLSRPWPTGRQETELAGLAIHAQGAETVVAGDFNMTPHAPAFWNFLALTGLRLATPPSASWPARVAGIPFPPLLSLDHILLGPGLGATVTLGAAHGSDHRPLIADICRLHPSRHRETVAR